MARLILSVAGLSETNRAVGLKDSGGVHQTPAKPPPGTASSIWTGIGGMRTVILGILLFGETATVARLACLKVVSPQ